MADLYTGTNLPTQVIEKIGGSSNGRFADDTPNPLKYLCTDLYPPQPIAPGNAILRQAFVHGENMDCTRARRQLERLFTARQDGWGSRHHPLEIEPLVEARALGDLSVAVHWVSREILESCDRGRAWRSASRGESAEHYWLKLVGARWLFERWRISTKEEVWSSGHKWDVANPEAGVVFECGNTDCKKAITALQYPAPWRFFILPYSAAAREWLDGPETWFPHVAVIELMLTEEGAVRIEERLIAGMGSRDAAAGTVWQSP